MSSRKQKALGVWTALGILALLLLLFYWKNLVGIPFEKRWFWEDFVYQNYPYRAYLAEELRRGIFPHWNPYQFGGMPYSADIQAAPFYLPNALLALFVTAGTLSPVWVEWLGVIHALLGGAFLFLLLRNRFGCNLAALMGGTAWSLGGFFVVRMIHGNIVSVVAWAPLILLLLMVAGDRRSFAASALGGVAFGMSTLAGSPQYTLYIAFLLAGWTIASAIRRPKGKAIAVRWAPFAHLAIVVGIGAGLSAIQFLPTRELAEMSFRSEMTYEKSTECSMAPVSLSTLLMPTLFGETGGWNNGGYWGPGKYFYYWELTSYVGVVVILLAGLAIVHKARERLVLFAIMLGAIATLLALGKHGPLHPIFYHLVPVYDKFRCPGRAMLLANIALVILAARGMVLLGKRPPKDALVRTIAVPGTLFVLAVAGWLAAKGHLGSLPPGSRLPAEAASGLAASFALFVGVLVAASVPVVRWVTGRRPAGKAIRWGLYALLVVELFLYGFGYNDGKVDPETFYRGKTEIVALVEEEISPPAYRVKTRAPEGMVLPRNQGSVNRLPSVDGYNQLMIERFNRVHTAESIPLDKRLDILGVRLYTYYDAARRQLTMGVNDDALPKAYFVGTASEVGGTDEALTALASLQFDPHVEVVLESREASAGVTGARGSANLVSWEANRIDVVVECDGEGWVVLNEVWYPAWKVYVNGEERESMIANHTLRAVKVDSGKSEISWRYESDALFKGALISGVTLLLTAIFIAFSSVRYGDTPLAVGRAMLSKEQP